jgi:hypothetical protein
VIPSTLQGLLIVLLAIAPGFLAATYWARAKTRRVPASDLHTILQALALSLVVQVIVAPLTYRFFYPVRAHIYDYDPRDLVGWLVLTVLVVPLVLGVALGKFEERYLAPRRDRTGESALHRLFTQIWPPSPPSSWDWFFMQVIPDGSFVLVEFEDGTRVAGTWERNSFATTSPEPHGLILAREWLVDEDGNFTTVVAQSAGVLIPSDAKIKKVRVLK